MNLPQGPFNCILADPPWAFRSGRKLGKTHQNILCFVKGDGKRAAAVCQAANDNG